MPEDLQLAVIAITPEGRIRAVAGNRSLLGPVRLGVLASDALPALYPGLDMAALSRGEPVEAKTGQGLAVRLVGRNTEDGRILLATVPDTASEAAIQNLREEGEAALRERTTFFASLGHDLKTPLNAIIGFADMMRSGVRGKLPEAYQDYTQIIHESGQDLLLLVEDLLDLAKADARALRLDFEPVDLIASGASVMRQFSAQAERTGVTLVLDSAGEAWAHADARAVRQIWQNLISNAIKYSEQGGTVTLQAGASGDSASLSVKDEGAGMDAADLERVATPFAQGKNSSGRIGTGLGLAMVKQFVDLHDGQVRIDTEKGQGTCVTVTFKAADPADLAEFDHAAQ
ncbi:MAG: HAMP domain-containing histidine kinase [Hyphomonadaceae bacterium]|nr:HAMP domain-containing histidine kinase [Hyphomonadaceae bacterium]